MGLCLLPSGGIAVVVVAWVIVVAEAVTGVAAIVMKQPPLLYHPCRGSGGSCERLAIRCPASLSNSPRLAIFVSCGQVRCLLSINIACLLEPCGVYLHLGRLSHQLHSLTISFPVPWSNSPKCSWLLESKFGDILHWLQSPAKSAIV